MINLETWLTCKSFRPKVNKCQDFCQKSLEEIGKTAFIYFSVKYEKNGKIKTTSNETFHLHVNGILSVVLQRLEGVRRYMASSKLQEVLSGLVMLEIAVITVYQPQGNAVDQN